MVVGIVVRPLRILDQVRHRGPRLREEKPVQFVLIQHLPEQRPEAHPPRLVGVPLLRGRGSHGGTPSG